jgi:hypothetical protein
MRVNNLDLIYGERGVYILGVSPHEKAGNDEMIEPRSIDTKTDRSRSRNSSLTLPLLLNSSRPAWSYTLRTACGPPAPPGLLPAPPWAAACPPRCCLLKPPGAAPPPPSRCPGAGCVVCPHSWGHVRRSNVTWPDGAPAGHHCLQQSQARAQRNWATPRFWRSQRAVSWGNSSRSTLALGSLGWYIAVLESAGRGFGKPGLAGHPARRWGTVSGSCPHAQAGFWWSGTCRQDRYAFSPICPERDWTRTAEPALVRPWWSALESGQGRGGSTAAWR